MKSNRNRLILSIAIPLAVGGLTALITNGSMELFAALRQPPLSPPGWLFPIVWTILYILMGIASYLVLTSAAPREDIRTGLWLYGLQLAVNFVWPILFFNLQWFLIAFFWLILLWILVIVTTVKFYRIDSRASYLLLPYLLWTTFAAYLNLGIFVLNG